MKTRAEVTPEKLRGGFYTPPPLVAACLARVSERLPEGPVDFLEPSAGDGAFVRALGHPDWHGRIGRVTAIEPFEIEAEKCRRALSDTRLEGEVRAASVISWASERPRAFDVSVGNPPFVRYQFVSPGDRAAIGELGRQLGIAFTGVSNLWIPVLLAALGQLREGGVFAFVIPTECLTGCSAATVRQWLVDHCAEVSFDLFAPGSFPGVLQEVAILSGRRDIPVPGRGVRVEIVDHGSQTRRWTHRVTEAGPWTRYLLDPIHLAALEEAERLPLAQPLGALARFAVGIVTGATSFFTVDDETLRRYALGEWARPLLPRLRHASGLVYTAPDHELTRAAGARAWLLDFAEARPDPLGAHASREYLGLGEEMQLHARYKCRIRDPWYRVPGIVHGELLLSKRSHAWPRIVVNGAGAFTTDTIYRGRMAVTHRTAADVAATFQNSLTLLTAELEGRSFGGGVHELVPSEIARLITLVPAGAGETLRNLDRISRTGSPADVIQKTDEYLVAAGSIPADLVPLLREAREQLASRRIARNRRVEPVDAASPAARAG